MAANRRFGNTQATNMTTGGPASRATRASVSLFMFHHHRTPIVPFSQSCRKSQPPTPNYRKEKKRKRSAATGPKKSEAAPQLCQVLI